MSVTKDDLTSPGLPRTSSIQTFDSLDFARYSDDGGGQVDERVAVLEFELRKAQDTIKSLRASLTREIETDLGSNENLDEGIVQPGKDDQIKPLEKRAINFLVNEYLLLNNYKLTSVTFSEENEDQDFEDWDDVGLNKPRPPDLLHLFKDYGSHTSPDVDMFDASCSVASFDDEEMHHLQWQWDQDRELLESRIDCLEEQLNSVREDYNLALQQLSDVKSQKSGDVNSADSYKNRTLSIDNETLVGDESHDFVNTSSSLTTENLLKSTAHSTDSRDDSTVIVDTERANSEHNSYETGDSDFIVIEHHSGGMIPECLESPSSTSTEGSYRKLSSTFKKALLDVCFHVAKDNRLITEMSKIVGTSKDSVVLMLGRCLPHIVPNVLLAKREELIPLILCTAMLHPDTRERDNLLNILFNLIKKPDDEQRQMILTGCIAYAEHVGQARLEEELLPQCWEQISHKYVERRLLVAEACGALASYLPPEILSSLVLSMLQQMLMDDKDEEVREAVVRSLGLLIGFITDQDKYSQAYELLKSALKDSSERVVMATQHVFLPSFASWAFELGKLEHNLIHSVIKDLEELVKATPYYLLHSLSSTGNLTLRPNLTCQDSDIS
ncbi:hypothetical protein KUTeg_018877 [Tegillarca granosa]|uniref:LisH domain and HEAT repeat-containing protein KIAA1468 homolog n=1 Tax=Tegillarca granosa TaxID=220873 RepID=A0ABQ9EAW4_TEGGR|nr:hypothetical protein KUTeg_018877 [Tegillarca granosa]